MNHQFPDNYHGYPRSGSGAQDLPYGMPYGDPTTMTRMSHPRESYPVPGYRDMRHMTPMIDPAMMYNQQSRNPYPIADYSAYGMHRMNHPMMSGHPRDMSGHPRDMSGHPRDMSGHPRDMSGHPRDMSGHPRDMSGHPRDMGGHPRDMSGHPRDMSGHPRDLTSHPRDLSSHPRDASSLPRDVSNLSRDASSLPRDMSAGNMNRGYYGSSIPEMNSRPEQPTMRTPASAYSHMQQHQLQAQSHMGAVMPRPGHPALQNQGPIHHTSQITGQSIRTSSQASQGHQLSPPSSNLPTSVSYGTHGSPQVLASGSHQVPQHPMRQPTTQQNPQEVADNILQMASSFPSNQTVQVPLKGRPAPYHIPRSPHFSVSQSHSEVSPNYSVSYTDVSHMSPLSSAHQQHQSPIQSHTSPSPSSNSVKSPPPVLAPIPNPISSPGISDIRSPCNQGPSTCGAQQSPSHIGSSYSGHGQGGTTFQANHNVSQNPQNSSAPSNGNNHQQFGNYNMPPNFLSYSSTPTQRNTNVNLADFNNPVSSSPTTSGGNHSNFPVNQNAENSRPRFGNNPLLSLEKLVMLPETQVVDPKSVVNDACLTAQQNDQVEGSKNVERPADGLLEGSSLSVGCPYESSPCTIEHTAIATSSGDNPNEMRPVDLSQSAQCDAPLAEKLDTELSSTQIEANDNVPAVPDDISHSTEKIPTDNILKHDVSAGIDLSEVKENVNDQGIGTPEVISESKDMTFSGQFNKGMKEVEVSLYVKTKDEGNDADSGISESEGLSQNRGQMLSSDSLDVSMENETVLEIKSPMTFRRSPGVLSEVPFLTNGEDSSLDETIHQDLSKEILVKVSRELHSIKQKLSRTKRISPIVRMTPCSITVGANERAACDRFAVRRSGFSRSVRSSRNSRNERFRNDSVENGDSDESLESLSENNMLTGAPQDGNKKRSSTTSRKSDSNKKSNASHRVVENGSKRYEAVSNNNGLASCNNHADVSDEEMGYYEGVDNTDVFVNHFSSDESLNSCSEVKVLPSPNVALVSKLKSDTLEEQNDLTELKHDEKQSEVSKKNEATSELPSSPPKKRKHTNSENNSFHILTDIFEVKNDENSDKSYNAEKKGGSEISPRRENGPGIVKPLIIRNIKRFPVVVLDKSDVMEEQSQAKTNNSNISEQNAPDSSSDTFESRSVSKFIEPKLESCNDDLDPVTKNEEEDQVANECPKNEQEEKCLNGIEDTNNQAPKEYSTAVCTAVKKSIPKRRKKTMNARGKMKKKSVKKPDKKSEVADSFKSMKFSRTLDLMKAQKKREIGPSGPFIRIKGKKSEPLSVNVFHQSIVDSTITSGKQGTLKKKQSIPTQPTTVVHATNLPSEKSAMAPSSRTINKDTTSWACVFCGFQCSYKSMGDLFGPYYRGRDIDRLDKFALEESKQGDTVARDRKQGEASTSSKRHKTSTGKLKSLKKSKVEEPPEEFWVHEACAMWSPGVYLVDGKLYGLDDAIRDATDSVCSECKQKGAMVGCLYKGCSMKFHVVCAIEKDCYMDEENLSLLCPKHKDKKLKAAAVTAKS